MPSQATISNPQTTSVLLELEDWDIPALQFANKMGCEVTPFSGSTEKENDALELGAHNFVNTHTQPSEELKVSRLIDPLLICANTHIDWSLFTPLLAGRAIVFPL
jgi:D-arabinose 1-dehydrogenase-like Zn-dependent alcohol dehydrogenase